MKTMIFLIISAIFIGGGVLIMSNYRNEINTDLLLEGALVVTDSTELKQVNFTALGSDAKKAAMNTLYPVGTVYINKKNVSPITFLGGTWERIEDVFLLAAGTKYTAGSTGGSADAVLVEHEHGERGNNENYDFPQFYKQQGGESSSQNMFVYNTTYDYYSTSTDAWKRLYTESVGESGAGKNMPPYLVVYAWERVEDEI